MCSTKAITCPTRPSATSPTTRACVPPPTGWKPTAKNLTKLLAQHPLPGDLGKLIEQVPELAREIKTQQQFMFSACEQVADFRPGEDVEGRERPRHRFVGGMIPEHMREMGIELKKRLFNA